MFVTIYQRGKSSSSNYAHIFFVTRSLQIISYCCCISSQPP